MVGTPSVAEEVVRFTLGVEVRHLVLVLQGRHAVVVKGTELARVLERRPDDVRHARGLGRPWPCSSPAPAPSPARSAPRSSSRRNAPCAPANAFVRLASSSRSAATTSAPGLASARALSLSAFARDRADSEAAVRVGEDALGRDHRPARRSLRPRRSSAFGSPSSAPRWFGAVERSKLVVAASPAQRNARDCSMLRSRARGFLHQSSG